MHETFPNRLAFTDIEATGMWPPAGEIIEIGLVVAEAQTLEVVDRLNVKVRPTHIETAVAGALRVSGYRPEDWQEAVSLRQALDQYVKRAHGAVFCAWRVAFDFSFLQFALETNGFLPKEHFTDHLCVYTMAWYVLREKHIKPFRLRQVAEYLGLPPEPEPHRAVNGAELAWAVYRKLMTGKV
ncbi:MAG: 3'-5' exonuclease [Candidatus Kerfeldbacteria bacterium]|nr:3'-5' exonuclease [Candidatus Kerfeldbacteria bacterium]